MKDDLEMFEVSRADPDLLRLRKADEWFKLFGGGVLIVVGIYVLLIPVDVLPVHGRPLPWFFAVPFGGAMAVLGAFIIGPRQDLMIDRRNRTIILKRGFVVPYRQLFLPLEEYDRVALDKEVVSGQELSYNTVFKVLLENVNDTAEPVLVMVGEMADVRKGGVELASYLSLPLESRLQEGEGPKQ